MMRTSILSALALLSGFLLLPRPGAATTFFERPFPDTVQEVPIIVRGIVGNSYSNWAANEDGGRRIYTFYDLQVSERLKGTVESKTLLMREIGGEKDGIGMQVAGSAHFDRGEDVVVMLSARNSDGSYDIRGMMMGKFNIEKDEDGKEVLVGGGLSGGHGGHHDDSVRHVEGHDDSGATPKPKWTIESLRQLIQTQERQARQNPSPLPSLRRVPDPSPTEQISTDSPAPQLQNSPAEETTVSQNAGFPRDLALKLGGLAVLGFVALLWIRSRQRKR